EQIRQRPEFQILAIAAESQIGKVSEANAQLERAMSAFASPKAYATAAVLFLTASEAALAHSDVPDLHELYGKLLEEHGDSVNAAHELQRAAELDSSEANIHAWG